MSYVSGAYGEVDAAVSKRCNVYRRIGHGHFCQCAYGGLGLTLVGEKACGAGS